MSTPEPPKGPTHPPRPGPGGEPGEASGGQEARTEEIRAQDHSADVPGGETSAEHRAEPAAATAASTSSPEAAADGRRRWRLRRPRRRWPLVTGAVVVGLLVLGLVFGLGALAGAHHARYDRFAQGGQPGVGHGRMHGHGRHGMGPGGHSGRGGMGPDGMGGGPADGSGGQFGRGAAAAPAVTGSLVTINGTTMVITQDGGAQATVTVSPGTRVVGPQKASLADLKAGDRVAVREDANHQAIGVLVVPARAVGTITAVNGNQATLVRPDGLTEPVDLTAVTTKPAVGDHVMVEGTASAGGATLAATQLQQLPKAG